MSIAGKHLVFRAGRTLRTANRDRRRALESDLACCTSDADRADLQATFDRYPDAVTQEMRDILSSVHRAQSAAQSARERDGLMPHRPLGRS